MTIEIGYAGRLSHRLLMEGDMFTRRSNISRIRNQELRGNQNANQLRSFYDKLVADGGLTPGRDSGCQTNPESRANACRLSRICFRVFKNTDIQRQRLVEYFKLRLWRL